MFMSPRTRHRALDVAKDAYGKVNDKLGIQANSTTQPNGLVKDHGTEYSTGL
jgi:hypothetical protein